MNMLKRDLGTGDLCDNIGLVRVSAKWSYVTASPSHHEKALKCKPLASIFGRGRAKELLHVCDDLRKRTH